MYKYYLSIIILSLFISISCSKKDDHIPKELKISKLQVKYSYDPSDITTYDFEYPADSEIKIKLTYTFYDDFWLVYRFNQKHLLSEIRFESINEVLIYKTVYTYNAKTICALLTVDCQTTHPRVFDSIVYNIKTDGFAFMATEYNDPDGGWVPKKDFYFSWSNGELQSIVTRSGSDYDTVKFISKSGPNPVNFTELPMLFSSGQFLMCGQHLGSIEQDPDLASVKPNVYEYNADDYPWKIVKYEYGENIAGIEYRFAYIPK
jgi:hypothetical protein